MPITNAVQGAGPHIVHHDSAKIQIRSGISW
jgi:hypothetical protein